MPQDSATLRQTSRLDSSTALQRRLMYPIAQFDYIDRPAKIHFYEIYAGVTQDCLSRRQTKVSVPLASRQIFTCYDL
jgi:hypothetical protein